MHSPSCVPCCPGYTPSHLIMRRREKNYETELRHHHAEGLERPRGVFCYRSYTIVSGAVGHGCWPLYIWNWENISTIWEKQKQIKCETGLGFALPCTRSVFILFYFIVGLLLSICLFIFFHSPFMKSGLGSEGHHAHGHITQPRIFQEYLPGLLRGCNG